MSIQNTRTEQCEHRIIIDSRCKSCGWVDMVGLSSLFATELVKFQANREVA